MMSTFYYKEHPKHSGETGVIKADTVEFVPGFVVFYEEHPIKKWPWKGKRIIKAVHASSCHDLREVLNDPSN